MESEDRYSHIGYQGEMLLSEHYLSIQPESPSALMTAAAAVAVAVVVAVVVAAAAAPASLHTSVPILPV